MNARDSRSSFVSFSGLEQEFFLFTLTCVFLIFFSFIFQIEFSLYPERELIFFDETFVPILFFFTISAFWNGLFILIINKLIFYLFFYIHACIDNCTLQFFICFPDVCFKKNLNLCCIQMTCSFVVILWSFMNE